MIFGVKIIWRLEVMTNFVHRHPCREARVAPSGAHQEQDTVPASAALKAVWSEAQRSDKRK